MKFIWDCRLYKQLNKIKTDIGEDCPSWMPNRPPTPPTKQPVSSPPPSQQKPVLHRCLPTVVGFGQPRYLVRRMAVNEFLGSLNLPQVKPRH